MKARGILTLMALVGLCQLLAGQNVPTEIKLTNGFVMHRCSVIHWTEDTITVKYVGGIVPVKISNIHPSQRAMFEKGVADGMKSDAAHDARMAQHHSHHAEPAEPKDDSKAAEEAERLASAIDRGVTNHYLVKGMTPEQVRQAYGGPTGTSESMNSAVWTFARRSKYVWTFDGTQKDVTLYFYGGHLTGWDNY